MIDTDFEKDMRSNCPPLDEYLDGLIAKASPQWAGVDVDTFMDMVRGQELDNTPRREGDEMSDYIASINPDWAFVVEKQ